MDLTDVPYSRVLTFLRDAQYEVAFQSSDICRYVVFTLDPSVRFCLVFAFMTLPEAGPFLSGEDTFVYDLTEGQESVPMTPESLVLS